MRVVQLSLLVALVACGGTKKPAESPSADTESADTTSTETVPTAGGEGTADGGAASTETTAAAEADAGGSAATPAESAPSEPAAPAHPVPTVTGSIDGKPFAPKMAHVTKPMQKDGRILLTLDERTDCGGGDLKSGEAALTLLVPWEDGYKVDVGSLRGGKKHAGDVAFTRIGSSGKKEAAASSAFKPTGRVTIVSAPSDENSWGKLNVDMQSGDYMLSGDLDIQVCVSPKAAAAAKTAKPAKSGKKKK